MALSSAAKIHCLDEAIKITTAFASAREKGDYSPETVLENCYKTLLKLTEDAKQETK